MNQVLVITCSLLYLLLLFVIAYYAERKLRKGRSIINNPYVYALSLAVYCTAWTYYGSVGKAAYDGIGFVAIYLGPTIMMAFAWPILRKIIRITKVERISSIADFVSTRYGKNFSVGIIVTLLCIIGVVPYISIQLEAITDSFGVITSNSNADASFFTDTTFYIAIILALFIILFGTRSVDVTEKHEGLVAAVAFESIIKLVAFICAGVFVTYFLFNGFGDVFAKGKASAGLNELFTLNEDTSYANWISMIFLSMMAIFFLPRQFQVSVVENIRERHVNKAMWLFPLYLFVINIFVLPIAFAGRILSPEADADTFVLSLPLSAGNDWLGLFVYIGGFSAATSMIIVETIAISTMISNNIVMPLILSSSKLKNTIDSSFSSLIIYIRRFSIVLILILAYLYDKYVAQHFSIASIGLVSFAAVAQFAPAIILGIYWKGASKNGALAGIISGFVIWFFTLVVPSLPGSESVIQHGLFGLEALKPNALFGLSGLDPVSHSLFWSMFFNLFLFVAVSVYARQKAQELYQAEIFVNVHKYRHSNSDKPGMWKGTASIPDLFALLENFLGKERAGNLIRGYAQRNGINMETAGEADPLLVDFSEKVLAGVIGSASARIMVSSVTKEEEISIDEVLKILQESQQMIELNKELRKKSIELTRATDDLRKVNRQLKDMDALKDEFLYTVTHELRTPITSIRAMSEIVHDNEEMDPEQRRDFLERIVRETERLSHLITQVLNLERYESGRQKLNLSSFSMVDLAQEVYHSMEPLAQTKNIRLQLVHPDSTLLLHADKDLLRQVMINLLSNAVKFTPENGKVDFIIVDNHEEIIVTVQDNGKGIPKEVHPFLFDKFFQARNQTLKKPEGSGLGLAISKKIVLMHGGKIWVESEEGKGSRFVFLIPNFIVRSI